MEEYLTVSELSSKIKFSKQSLYNFIHKGTFVIGKHYLKPTPKKVLFKWSKIQAWMEESSDLEPRNRSESKGGDACVEKSTPARSISSINI